MKSTLSVACAALAVGVLAGVAVGFWEARFWTANHSVRGLGGQDPAAPAAAAGANSDDAAGAPGEAKAVFAETEYHFGNMESGATQRHTFPVHNEGQRPLTLNYVSHSCKCTEVRLNGASVEPGASIVVRPGEAGEVELEWAAKVDPGPFRHGATFTTNDPKLDRVEVLVIGDIVASTTLEPSQLYFGSVHVGQPGKAEMMVMAFLDPKVEILSHEVLPPELAEHVQVALEPVAAGDLPNPQARAGVKVIATYDPGDTLGQFAGSLRLMTSLKNAAQLEVPLYGTVNGDISIRGIGWNETSGLLQISPVASSAGGQSPLSVNVRGEHANDVELSVESVSPPELRATLGERKTLREGLVSVPLVIEIPAGTRPMVRAGDDQGGEGEIILATTHPNTAKVRLRVRFTVMP